jgi:uroporphyrinogen III methyltransferase/synthase
VAVDCVPDEATADAIPDALARFGPPARTRILLARADAASAELPRRLRDMGAEVDDVVAYSTEPGGDELRPALLAALADPQLEAVIFASGSAVRGLVETARAGVGTGVLGRLKVITIGPKTSAVARENGLTITKESSSRDSKGLAAALRTALDEEVERWLAQQLRLPA